MICPRHHPSSKNLLDMNELIFWCFLQARFGLIEAIMTESDAYLTRHNEE